MEKDDASKAGGAEPKGPGREAHGAKDAGGAKGMSGAKEAGAASRGKDAGGASKDDGAGAAAKNEDGRLSERLAALTKGLLFMSESDYPLEPFVREAGGAASAREAALGSGADARADVKELDFDTFFSNSTREQDWQDEAARATVKKFQALVSFMKESLSEIKVYRVGGVEADVYIVGRTRSGGFAGVKTKVVET